MHIFYRFRLLSIVSALVFAVVSPSFFKADASSQSSPLNGDNLVSRGKYIVEDVAMCVECHTPRDDRGRLIEGENLKGAPVPVKPPEYPQIKWAPRAPAIAGMIGYTEQEGVRLLTSGETRDGRVPDPPMPPFRMSVRDAEAVVAYLKSL